MWGNEISVDFCIEISSTREMKDDGKQISVWFRPSNLWAFYSLHPIKWFFEVTKHVQNVTIDWFIIWWNLNDTADIVSAWVESVMGHIFHLFVMYLLAWQNGMLMISFHGLSKMVCHLCTSTIKQGMDSFFFLVPSSSIMRQRE